MLGPIPMFNHLTKILGCNSEWHTYDLTLKSGKRVLANLCPSLICNVEEIRYNKYHLSWKFPFVRKETRVCTRFVQHKSTESWDDDCITYTVDCSLKAFMGLFGLEPRWNSAMMKSDVKYGKHD